MKQFLRKRLYLLRLLSTKVVLFLIFAIGVAFGQDFATPTEWFYENYTIKYVSNGQNTTETYWQEAGWLVCFKNINTPSGNRSFTFNAPCTSISKIISVPLSIVSRTYSIGVP